MLTDTINDLINIYHTYMGDMKYWCLFLVSFFIILILEKDKPRKHFLALLCITFALLFMTPVLGYFLLHYGLDTNTYRRIYWLLPIPFVIAWSATLIVNQWKKKWLQSICILLLTVLLICCGTLIYGNNNYSKLHNYEKVPDEVLVLTEAIRSDAQKHNIQEIHLTTAYDEDFFRQYDASIYLTYGRYGRNRSAEHEKTAMYLYQEIQSQHPNYDKIHAYMKELHGNYFIYHEDPVQAQQFAEDYGYRVVANHFNYTIYAL